MKNQACSSLLFMLSIAVIGPRGVVAQTSQDAAARLAAAIRKAPPPPGLKLPQGVTLDRPLSEDDAVAIGLWNNAALQASLADLGVAKADLLEAGLLRNPSLQLLLPFGYTQFEMLLNLPGEVLWQRRRRVTAAKIAVDRVAKGLEQNGLEVVCTIRLAYVDLLAAQERIRIGEENLGLVREIARLTDARLSAGDISGLEANLSRLDVAAAEEQQARYLHDRELAHNQLRYQLGLEEEKASFEISIPAPGSRRPAPAGEGNAVVLESLQAGAFATRPDLLGSALAIEAAAARAKWERSKLFSLAELLSIKQGAGLDFSPRGGILAELPVFHRNKGGITRADMEVERAGMEYLAVRQRVAREVREAHALANRAGESLRIHQTRVLAEAAESIRLAESSYRSGAESYLFVLEATRRWLDARMREVDLIHELRRADIRLDRSVGRKHNANQ